MGTGTGPLRAVGYLDELRRIVPTEQIESHATSDRELGDAWAVEPATQVELVEVLKWANLRHAAVFTRRPRRSDAAACGLRPRIYLRGRRMGRVKDLDIESGTVTVQSGITMSELHRVLGERSYTTGFPTRPWRDEPLGGILAATLDAHWGPRFGSMEDQVLRLGVVFPDGTVASGSGAPRKAVGPDFDRLFLGSRGRFGIIYEATLRIYPSATRVALSYAAPNLTTALAAISDGLDQGLDPRAIEVLTPALDRAWGRKRAGLTDQAPVLVLVEPWGPLAGRPVTWTDEHFSAALTRLEPPAGWSLHEGLLPAARAWTAPVVGLRWNQLQQLAEAVADDAPAGLWIVRMSRQGAWLSIDQQSEGPAAERVRGMLDAHRVPIPSPWATLQRHLETELDPKGILNPIRH